MYERIRQKIGRIRQYLMLLDSLKDNCQQRFNSDPLYQGALLHFFYLMADSCVSLAGMVIKEMALRPPQSYYDAFDVLGENDILDREFAYHFARIAGFRNFLAHDYEKVDTLKICQDAFNQLHEVESYLKQIEAKLKLL